MKKREFAKNIQRKILDIREKQISPYRRTDGLIDMVNYRVAVLLNIEILQILKLNSQVTDKK